MIVIGMLTKVCVRLSLFFMSTKQQNFILTNPSHKICIKKAKTFAPKYVVSIVLCDLDSISDKCIYSASFYCSVFSSIYYFEFPPQLSANHHRLCIFQIDQSRHWVKINSWDHAGVQTLSVGFRGITRLSKQPHEQTY